MEKRLVGVDEAAAYVGMNPGTVRNEISQGTLPFPYIKNGRRVLFDLRDLDKWIDRLPRVAGKNRGKGHGDAVV